MTLPLKDVKWKLEDTFLQGINAKKSILLLFACYPRVTRWYHIPDLEPTRAENESGNFIIICITKNIFY